jgi:hypothetical protein
MHCRYQVVTLDGIENLSNLKRLALCSGVDNLKPLAGLTELEELILQDTRISDLTPLSELRSLKRLEIRGSQVADLAPLANLTQLETLVLTDSQIEDLTPLSKLNRLKRLFLYNNKITDIRPLAGLNQLAMLNLSGNQIVDVMPIANKQALTNLYLARNQIIDTKPLTTLSSLIGLDLRCNPASINGHLLMMENLLWLDVRCTDISNPEITDQCVALSGRANDITLYINGICQEPDQPPIVESGCTLLPLSAVAKAIGAEITWNDRTKTAVMNYRNQEIRVPVDRHYAFHNGDRVNLYYQTQIRGGRTMIHSRLLVDVLGFKIHFDAENRIVLIDTD